MVQASTLGSEFIAMKTTVEQVEVIQYKIQMFRSPIKGPMNVFCDNVVMFKNASIPDYVIGMTVREL